VTVIDDGAVIAERLSVVLREATRPEHERAQQSAFLRDLVAGRLPVAAYAALATQHYLIYATLEQAAEVMRDDPVAGRFVDDDLARVPALETDLRALLGEDWADQVRPGDATARYVARLREVCFTWPAGFIAHHYTRYLGDLSGGRAIGAAVRRVYGFGDGPGARFYRFDTSGARVKDAYRARLDALAWDRTERERFVAEVITAYRLNTAVLADLETWCQSEEVSAS